MRTPPALARHPLLDAAAREILALMEPLGRAQGLARLEELHAGTPPGPARRALLAARVALLRDGPAFALPPPEPEPPAPEPEPVVEETPVPPPPKPVVIPQLDLAAMMSLFDEPEEDEEEAPIPAPEPEPDPEPDAPAEGWTRIRLTEDGPRGPASFPKGASLSVKLEDAARLLMAGIAEELEEEEAPAAEVQADATAAPIPDMDQAFAALAAFGDADPVEEPAAEPAETSAPPVVASEPAPAKKPRSRRSPRRNPRKKAAEEAPPEAKD
ncbi:hypothetical protein LV780_07625 [Cereibacter azotoformans]|uniref:Uncharacterized protein n=1 Tax=Cereibacter azotoformans TaxID=43057 RepID=A0A2T5KDJ1_9RHOB|nr:hypothetical protein [Cereibacter azotoformans]MBO4168531.1 hypothetical protein [Cereibacter azotoformans]PTR20479.1 hypothetical protein C8J28_102244 [Cereibacter azotoformans]UIJ29193.1 hypothetical protein LV780_07625 [Cereibacter azotoformans]